MKSFAIASAALFLMASGGVALAAEKSSCPEVTANMNIDQLPEKCQAEFGDWTMKQSDTSIDFQGDVAIGAVVPGTIEFMEVPAYKRYGYVVLNGKRVLVDRDSRKVIRVY